MKTRNTITKLIAITLALAAMAVVGSIWTTEAQGRIYVATDVGVYGFVHGQTARFSAAYPSTTEEGSQPVRVQAYIYDSYGNLLSQTDPVELPADQFRSFDFNRDDLPLAGEPGTGRLQVRGVIQVAFMDGSVRPFKIPVSMELVDNRTGATVGGPYFTGSITVSDDGFGGY